MNAKVDDVKRYEFVTGQMRYFSDRMRDSFKLYIQIVTAMVGGLIFFFSQSASSAPPVEIWIFTLATGPAAIIFVGFFLALQIAYDFQCWFGYRVAESKLTEGKAPPPSFPESAWSEIWFVGGMTAGSVFGSYYLWRVLEVELPLIWALALWATLSGFPIWLMSRSGRGSASTGSTQEKPNPPAKPNGGKGP